MPIEKIQRGPNRVWGLWRITEDEDVLCAAAGPVEQIPGTLANPGKRLEFIAARVLVMTLMNELGLRYSGIRKDEFGKPFPSGHDLQLSLSHSYPYVAALIDTRYPVGIDLEQFKPKLLRIAPRVLSPAELTSAGSDIQKHCVYWCAKEAMIKIHGKKDLVFAENLLIEPFERKSEGEISGRIIVNSRETRVPLYYQINAEFAVVLNV